MRRLEKVLRLLTVAVLLVGPSAIAQELRAPGQAHSAGPAITGGSKKIVARLRGLIADFRAQGITRATAAAMNAATRFSSPTLKVDNAGRVQVYVLVTDTTARTLAILRQHDLDIEIVNQDSATVQGWIPVEYLEGLAGEAVVVKIRPPRYGMPRTGSVNTQGDAIPRCDQARATFGSAGARVRVGVVSTEGLGLEAAQTSGDLPSEHVPTKS